MALSKRKLEKRMLLHSGQENLDQASNDTTAYLKSTYKVIRCLLCNTKFTIFKYSQEYAEDVTFDLLEPMKQTVYCPFCGK